MTGPSLVDNYLYRLWGRTFHNRGSYRTSCRNVAREIWLDYLCQSGIKYEGAAQTAPFCYLIWRVFKVSLHCIDRVADRNILVMVLNYSVPLSIYPA